MSALPPKADMCGAAWDVRYGPSGGPIAPYELARRFDRLLADKPVSTSEDPMYYFVGICIETSAMAEQNTLRLPRVNFSDCRFRLAPLEE
jgi:hypothetical protein